MKRELSALRAEMAALHEENQRALRRQAPTPQAAEPLSPEAQEQRFLAHVAQVEQSFRDEPRDHAWSESMVGQIRAAATSEGVPAGFVQDIDCRTRTCKLELAPLEPRAQEPAVEALILKLAADLPHATMGHDGNLTAPKLNALYLALPSPDDYLPPVARQ
jgi:hypothetical protein